MLPKFVCLKYLSIFPPSYHRLFFFYFLSSVNFFFYILCRCLICLSMSLLFLSFGQKKKLSFLVNTMLLSHFSCFPSSSQINTDILGRRLTYLSLSIFSPLSFGDQKNICVGGVNFVPIRYIFFFLFSPQVEYEYFRWRSEYFTIDSLPFPSLSK